MSVPYKYYLNELPVEMEHPDTGVVLPAGSFIISRKKLPRRFVNVFFRKSFLTPLMIRAFFNYVADVRVRKNGILRIKIDKTTLAGFVFEPYSGLKYTHWGDQALSIGDAVDSNGDVIVGDDGTPSVQAKDKFTDPKVNGNGTQFRCKYVGLDTTPLSDVWYFPFDFFLKGPNGSGGIRQLHIDPIIRNNGSLPP